MRISDWSSDVCSSDLGDESGFQPVGRFQRFIPFPQRRFDAAAVGDVEHGEKCVAVGQRHGGELQMPPVLQRQTAAALAAVGGGGADEVDRKSTRLTPVTNAHLVCRLLLEKKITKHKQTNKHTKTNTTKQLTHSHIYSIRLPTQYN